MGLARDLVDLERLLRGRTDVNLFVQDRHAGLLAVSECASLIGRIGTLEPLAVMRLCLQALRIQHTGLEAQLLDAELVATLPPDTPGLARPTERVVHEMIERAGREIILLGYELSDEQLVGLLANASGRGAEVIMICDRNRGTAAKINSTWPRSSRRPRIFQDRARPDAARYASMHAKCLLVDGNDLLVTSANFTFHGLHGNIEIGVRLSGAPAAEARKIFSHLVESRVVEELQPTGSQF
jgi:phosphatidylserine/phosphatidylglycerophosphate/cardiolipin synthase-like enzyme